MSPIKFRIWDEDQGKILPVITMFYSADGKQWFGFQREDAGLEPASLEYCEAYNGDPTVSVMQFTGLYDRKGKDIYEGDILRCKHFIDRFRKQHYLVHSVEWSEHRTGWLARNPAGDDGSVQLWAYMKNADDVEVIGNVHQHPELLGGLSTFDKRPRYVDTEDA